MPLNAGSPARTTKLSPAQRQQAAEDLWGVNSEMPQNNWIDPNKPPKVSIPTPWQEFPKMKYHPSGETKVVKDAIEEKKLGKAWVDKPFPAPVAAE